MSEPVWLAPGAQVYGKVEFAEGVSIWPNAVLRAESQYIRIGAYTNIQDFAMIHIGVGPTQIGAYCSITHHCTIHGATIGDNCLIGINATIMDNAEIGDNCTIAGHTIVTEGTIIPANSIVAGVPGKVVKTLDNLMANKLNALAYYENARAYNKGHHRRWADEDFPQLTQQWTQDIERERENKT